MLDSSLIPPSPSTHKVHFPEAIPVQIHGTKQKEANVNKNDCHTFCWFAIKFCQTNQQWSCQNPQDISMLPWNKIPCRSPSEEQCWVREQDRLFHKILKSHHTPKQALCHTKATMEFLSIGYHAQIKATNYLSGEKLTLTCISNKLLARSFWIFGHHVGHIILKNTETVKTESITTTTHW